MNQGEVTTFLFCLTKEIERSFYYPIILFTEKDYTHSIFRSLIDTEKALQDSAVSLRFTEITNAFHTDWLQAVDDIEIFKKRLKDTPREAVINAIDFTIKCLQKRSSTLSEYIEQTKDFLTHESKKLLKDHLDVLAEIEEFNLRTLHEKKTHITLQADQIEYMNQMHDELKELLNWLDQLYDNLAVQLIKLLNLEDPNILRNLTNASKQLINEIVEDPDPEAQTLAELIQSKDNNAKTQFCSVWEHNYGRLLESIRTLEDRISKLPRDQKEQKCMVLEHKTIYLRERLQSLQNFEQSIMLLKSENRDDDHGENVRIFVHVLPQRDRRRLVERLIDIWNCTLANNTGKSLISILSVRDFKEIYYDTNGPFSVDKYGRKIYSKDNDLDQYQLSDIDQLVPVKDTDSHIYFYDKCGRYYLNNIQQRVYKACEGASEYVINLAGVLVKVKEEKEGIEYFYDWLGRYFINRDGKQIYRDADSTTDYEDDGLGNLVRIKRSHFCHKTYLSEQKQLTLQENKYLQEVVGQALKQCISNVVVHQPHDPIAYLAYSLVKYRQDEVERQRHFNYETEKEQSILPT